MHTLRLKLNVDDNTAAVLEKRFRILAHISNQIRKKAKMMLSRLEKISRRILVTSVVS